jgi:hypothetical protein
MAGFVEQIISKIGVIKIRKSKGKQHYGETKRTKNIYKSNDQATRTRLEGRAYDNWSGKANKSLMVLE